MHASARPAMAVALVVVGLSVCAAYADRRHGSTAHRQDAPDLPRGPAREADARPEVEAAPPPGSEPPPEAGDPSCPDGMLLVTGEYCTDVVENCLEWQDPPDHPFARCARFAPSQCRGARVHKRFCVDRDEYTAPGDALPTNEVSWMRSRQICEGEGKRLCLESEWEFACEGEEMLPYPTGYTRDSVSCNFDKEDLIDPATGRLRDKREPSARGERCVSPFGVRDMTGNVDEWVWRDRTPGDWRSALKGGWWMPARDRCRPATTAHGEEFAGLQTGFRCCADARAPTATAR